MGSLKGTSILSNPFSYFALASVGFTGQQNEIVATYSTYSLGTLKYMLS